MQPLKWNEKPAEIIGGVGGGLVYDNTFCEAQSLELTSLATLAHSSFQKAPRLSDWEGISCVQLSSDNPTKVQLDTF